MRWFVGWGCLILAGCRFGFSTTDTGSGSGSGDAREHDAVVLVDVPDNVPTRVVSFGETGATTYANVTTDSFLDNSQNPARGYNYGASAQVIVDTLNERTGLVRFELSALPPTTLVAAAEFHLQTYDEGASSGGASLYRVLESWSEGGQDGNNGECNWLSRDATQAWANAGADAPSSRDPTVLATFTPLDAAADYTIPLAPEGIAVVQGWVANAATNFGFALISDSSRWKMSSRETSVASARPYLVLTVAP